MMPLAQQLREHFGDDFPVGRGSAKRDDPLVITEKRDYVSVEYAIAQFLIGMGGYEYKFERQDLHRIDGRDVDELIYVTKPAGTEAWAETRRYFFDITAGFHKEAEDAEDAEEAEEAEEEPSGHSERFVAFLANWRSFSRDNARLYREITHAEAPEDIRHLTDPVELYKRTYGKFGLRLTKNEELELQDVHRRFDNSTIARQGRLNVNGANAPSTWPRPSEIAKVAGPVIVLSLLGAFVWFVTGRFTIDLIVMTVGAAAGAYLAFGWFFAIAEQRITWRQFAAIWVFALGVWLIARWLLNAHAWRA